LEELSKRSTAYQEDNTVPAWPYAVVFSLVTKFLGAGARQFGFMLRGLVEMEAALAAKNIKFVLLEGKALPGSARHRGGRCPLLGGHVPITGGAGAHYRGGRCPLQGGQVPITGGKGAHYRVAGAHYRGGRCPVQGGQMPLQGGQVPFQGG